MSVFKATLSVRDKNHQKSSLLFWLLNMSIICQHVHRLELRNISLLHFGLLWQRHKTYRKPRVSVIPVFLKYRWATQNVKTLPNSSLWTC